MASHELDIFIRKGENLDSYVPNANFAQFLRGIDYIKGSTEWPDLAPNSGIIPPEYRLLKDVESLGTIYTVTRDSVLFFCAEYAVFSWNDEDLAPVAHLKTTIYVDGKPLVSSESSTYFEVCHLATPIGPVFVFAGQQVQIGATLSEDSIPSGYFWESYFRVIPIDVEVQD